MKSRKVLPGSGHPYAESKRHQGKPYLYWWDITPARKESLEQTGAIHFSKGDTGEEAVVEKRNIIPLLTKGTLAWNGHWAIKILRGRPNELVIDPGKGKTPILLHDVKWCPTKPPRNLNIDVPEEIYQGLEYRVKRTGRSIKGEIVHILTVVFE